MEPEPTRIPTDSREACPACGGAAWEPLFEGRGGKDRRAFTIARCRRCALVRTLDASGASYPAFDQSDTPLARASRLLVGQLLRERARIVAKVAPRAARGRLLDYGCGSGAFARLMSTRGYEVVGLEPFSLGAPTEEARLRLVRAPLDEVKDALGTFDVVTIWHVLEHVDDPGAVLRALEGLLRPGGVLVVSVPNFASWQSRLFRGGWFHLDPPRHVTHFVKQTLEALLAEVGLEPFYERTFHLEYGPAGWLQSALNRLTPRPNFLYELVKDRGALADVSPAAIGVNLLGSLAVGALVAAPSIAVEALAATRDAGAVLTVAARSRTRS